MRLKHFVFGSLVLLLGIVLTGCAGLSIPGSMENMNCTSGNISSMLASGEYQKKVDNFLIIQDASSSMSEKLSERLVPSEPTKLAVSRKLASCLNSSLPENFDVKAGLRIFGPVLSEKGLIYGMSGYSRESLENTITSVKGTGGITPLANAMVHAGMDLKGVPGDAAVIIVSDGVNTAAEDPVEAATALKEIYGENLCIYTIQVGDNPKGKMLLEQIGAAGKCGFATTADNLMTRTLSDGTTVGSDGMAEFVSTVFLEKAPPKPAPKPKPKPVDRDSDGDGVLDSLDKCPDTPRGIKVDSNGCPVPIPEKVSITLLVEFDFDKATVKPQYHNDLEKVANFLKAYPKTTATLEGHTDSIGTDEYNQKLSQRRAASVKQYLVDMFGIDAARLTAVGFGETQPVASNETAESRQRNRRIVATIATTIMK
jgi:OOP family OmpA-OmpF porin